MATFLQCQEMKRPGATLNETEAQDAGTNRSIRRKKYETEIAGPFRIPHQGVAKPRF